MYELGAKILLKLREGPLPSVRAVAVSVGEKPSNPGTTWRGLRRLRQDGLVVRVPGLGWVRRDDEAALSAWSEGLPAATRDWLQKVPPPFRFNGNGSPRYWNPDLDEVQTEVWRASGDFPRAEETPLAFAAMKQAARGGLLEELSVLPAHLNARETALRYGDYDLRRELLRRHPRYPSRAWDWRPPDEMEPGGTPRWVVWDGPEGTGENAEIFVPYGPAFRRGVPVRMPEPTAKKLVTRAEVKAKEVEDPLPPHFRYATAAEDKVAVPRE